MLKTPFQLIKIIPGVLVTLIISACGFHVQSGAGGSALAFDTLLIKSASPYRSLSKALSRGLSARGVTIATTQSEDTVVLEIADVDFRREVLSVDASGTAAEHKLNLSLRYRLIQAKQAPPAWQRLSVQQDITFDSNKVLSKSSEQDLMHREMTQQLSQLLIRHLQAWR